jgi:hypothetical protein
MFELEFPTGTGMRKVRMLRNEEKERGEEEKRCFQIQSWRRFDVRKSGQQPNDCNGLMLASIARRWMELDDSPPNAASRGTPRLLMRLLSDRLQISHGEIPC